MHVSQYPSSSSPTTQQALHSWDAGICFIGHWWGSLRSLHTLQNQDGCFDSGLVTRVGVLLNKPTVYYSHNKLSSRHQSSTTTSYFEECLILNCAFIHTLHSSSNQPIVKTTILPLQCSICLWITLGVTWSLASGVWFGGYLFRGGSSQGWWSLETLWDRHITRCHVY